MGSSRWLLKLHLHLSISTALMRPRRPKQYCLQLYIYIYIYMTISNILKPISWLLLFFFLVVLPLLINAFRCFWCLQKFKKEAFITGLCFLYMSFKILHCRNHAANFRGKTCRPCFTSKALSVSSYQQVVPQRRTKKLFHIPYFHLFIRRREKKH